MTIKQTYSFLVCLFISSFSHLAQSQENTLPELMLEKSEVEAHLRFLASDELMGRKTGEPGNNIAARYLATYYEALGLSKAPGLDSYYQPVLLQSSKPALMGSLKVGDQEFSQLKELVLTRGAAVDLSNVQVVYAGHGWVDEEKGYDDYKKLKVKGKIVITAMGTQDGTDFRTIFRSMEKKRELAAERGAVALIEVYQMRMPWASILRRMKSDPPLELTEDNTSNAAAQLPYGWLSPDDKTGFLSKLQKKKKIKGALRYGGNEVKKVTSQNVVGIIEGTDPSLKEEYMVISAHYDHVGTTGSTSANQDTIFNGARDNGMGVVALMSAAKAISKKPTKRSVIILAVTGEEMGLLGSSYYAEHPLIPMEKTIFNLNTDGAGYNDVSYLSAIGFGRTGTDELIEQGAAATGLNVFPNPAPDQNLFDRSDNVAFARLGVPAICISPGTTAFSDEIKKHYHQVTDEADSLDFDYLIKYCRSFAHIARLILEHDERPIWKEGDKYEEAGKNLYGGGKK